MESQFDSVIDRRNTRSYKWDSTPDGRDRSDLLQMWVADMDFQAAPEILAAMRGLCDHGVFGYSTIGDSPSNAYQLWLRNRYGLELPGSWMLDTTGVLSALVTAITSLTDPGDGIIIQPPVYYPFPSLIRSNLRAVVENPLTEEGGKWTIDLEGLEAAASNGARALLLCSPHNPVGRVWTKQELEGVLEICSRHRLLVISDEIHADIVFPGHDHVPLFTYCDSYDVDSVVLVSPTKTFNLAGVPMAWMIAPRAETKAKLRSSIRAAHASPGNIFAITAAETAYRECGYWVDELLDYIAGNLKIVKAGLAECLPEATLADLEGTYLAWIDFRSYGRGADTNRALLDEGGIRLNDGATFGRGGEGFHRLNLAAPRTRVEEAVERIGRAFS